MNKKILPKQQKKTPTQFFFLKKQASETDITKMLELSD